MISYNAHVRVMQDIPQITDDDLQEYGPYKAGEEATLPVSIAYLLQLAGYVRPVKKDGKWMIKNSEV